MRWWIAAVAVLHTVGSRPAPYVPDRPAHRLTAASLTAYVEKTFGPAQRCLEVTVDGTVEAAAVVAMLYGGGGLNATRTIELNDGTASRGPACSARVFVGRRTSAVKEYLDRFGSCAAERTLVIVVQRLNYVKPFTKYSPEHFNYKDVILISVNSQSETVYQMSIYYRKFAIISKKPSQWFRHDLEGKQRVKNFYKSRIKLLAYNNSLFSSVIKDNETGKLSLSIGVECSLFKEIALRLNITWDVYTTDDKDKWGTAWSNNTVTGGALKLLHNKQVDMAFCSLWIESVRLKFVDMSRFWTLMCLKFLVPKPQPLREKWDLIFKPFPLSLWLLVISSATLTTMILWTLAGVQKKIGYEKINAFTSLSSTIFWIIGMMLLTNNPRIHRLGPIKHLINWWCIFVFIMTTLFSSVLYSHIASPAFTDIVLEVEDMVKENYHWGLTYPPPLINILQMQNPVHRAFAEMFVPERGTEDRIGRLRDGKYAVLTKCLNEKHFMESETVPAAVLNDLRTARTCLNQFYIGVGFAKGSPYLRPANLVVRRIFESGLVDYWLNRVTETRTSPAAFKRVYETKPRDRQPPVPLSYDQFKFVAVVWTVGCALSAVVFAAECQYGAYVRRSCRSP